MKKDDAIEELSFLFNQYASHLPTKIQSIETQANHLFSDWQQDKYLELLRTVHSLNGSTALYSYQQLHTLANEMELKLQSLNEEDKFNAQKDVILNAIIQLKSILEATKVDEIWQLFLKKNLQGIGSDT